jgi:hypothetical protein
MNFPSEDLQMPKNAVASSDPPIALRIVNLGVAGSSPVGRPILCVSTRVS